MFDLVNTHVQPFKACTHISISRLGLLTNTSSTVLCNYILLLLLVIFINHGMSGQLMYTYIASMVAIYPHIYMHR